MSPRPNARIARHVREEAIDWVLRLDDGAVDDTERDALDRWLSADPLHQRAFREAEQLFLMSGKALADKPEQTKRVLRRRDRQRTSLFVALILVLAGAFWLADGPLHLYADAVTGTNQTRTLDLPDGSRIRLNAGSAIAEDFGPQQRKVTLLRGEAYFEVARDAARPFIVEAGAGQVMVLGTAFNVNVTSIDTEVTVTENTVRVSGQAGPESVSLRSGERVAYSAAGIVGTVAAVPQGDEAPWLSGRMIFEERALGTVVEQLARHLPGRFVVVGDALRQRRISGSFDLSDPELALAGFTAVFGLRAAKVGPLLTVLY